MGIKKKPTDHIIELIDKLERSAIDLNQRCKTKLYQPDGLVEEIRKHKKALYALYKKDK